MSKDYTECHVAFLDILGFKNLVMKEECDYLYNVFQQIRISSQARFKINDESVEAFSLVKHYVMSDSVILYIDASIKDSFFALVRTCQYLQMSLLTMETPILVRGGITSGSIFSENDVIYGKGLVNSYLLEENTAIYPRIIFTKQTLENGRKNYDKIRTDFDSLPFFKDQDELYSINFMSLAFLKDLSYIPSFIDHVLDFCQKNIDEETNDSIRGKFLWLKERCLYLVRCQSSLLNLVDVDKSVAKKWNIGVE